MHINMWLDDSRIAADRSAIVITGIEENVAASLPTSFTVRYFVTAQNPGPLGSSCRWTGASRRSAAYCSCGCPCANELELHRSTWTVVDIRN